MTENNLTLTERYRPKTLDQMIGNKMAIQQVEECILGSKIFIAHGSAGTGKTTVVRCIANNIGFRLVEWNASDSRKKEDLKVVLRQVQTKGFGTKGIIFFLDEMENCDSWETVAEIIKKARNPVAMACNDLYKIPQKIQQLCVKIRFWAPRTEEVCQMIARIEKATGRKANYQCINNDFRSSINNAFNSGSLYNSITPFEETALFFKKRETKQLTHDHTKWLIDNADAYYSGKTLFEMSQLLMVCDQLQCFTPLKVLPKGKMGAKCQYPRFIQKAKSFRDKKGDVQQ